MNEVLKVFIQIENKSRIIIKYNKYSFKIA